MCLGTIYKLHRNTTGFTLSDLAALTGLALSKLSDFENNKTQLSYESLNSLYAYIGIQATFPVDSETIANEKFNNLYNSILTLNNKHGYCYKEFREIERCIYCTPSYLIFLLGDFIYNVYYPQNQEYDYFKHIKTISDNIQLLKSNYKQIFYDAVGVVYKNNHDLDKADFYFNLALSESGTDQSLAMVLYHKSMVENQLGKLSNSLSNITKAKSIFDKNLIIKRSIMSNLSLGIVHVRLGNYKQGEELYLQCIEASQLVSLKNTTVAYNNLVWCYILSLDYKQAIFWGLKTIEIDNTLPMIYFYLSYASWKLKDMKSAKNYIQSAQQLKSKGIDYTKSIISAFSTLINQSLSAYKIEKMFLISLKEAKKLNDYQLQMFVYELIIDLYIENENEKKELYYKTQLLDLYKKVKLIL